MNVLDPTVDNQTLPQPLEIIHHVVIDLETVSLRNNAAVVAIGSCEVSETPGGFFLGTPNAAYISLASCEAAGLHIDKETTDWWGKQDPVLRRRVFGGTATGREVLTDFAGYIKSLKETGKIYVYGYGAKFDITILEEAFDAFDVQIPWTYKEVMCLRTLAMLVPKEVRDHFKSKIPHDPVEDALAEAKLLRELLIYLVERGV